ncbi:hypothetical protein BJ875DRAFT_158352 [Amylocarpus encephaloides]|uniref:Uncharacterized protein n=1 Tax=Amylocarpus encephaloides TaxID=45428 RepID=A0A9P7YAL0_9HELO|nr:hypothetical protein BJ875DRAFT_158352 [Amylocarpus encephaloides]
MKKQAVITLAEKMNLWNTEKLAEGEEKIMLEREGGNIMDEESFCSETEIPDLGRRDDRVALDQGEILDEDEDEDYAVTHFPEAWQFLTSSHAYVWLLARLKTEMLLTKSDGTPADTIRRDIMKGLASRLRKHGYGQTMSKARFQLSWSLPRFLMQQYPEERVPRLDSLITIIASGEDVQALTCAQYMSQVWPITGPETLVAVQGALDKGPGQSFKAVMTDKTRITLEINDSTVSAIVKGTDPAIAEIGQQLAWLGAALRPSPSDKMAYSTPRLVLSTTVELTFALEFQVTEFIHRESQQNGSCWRPLFRNSVIVDGYPILARANGEKGLEIALNMMAELGQASRATNFDGGLVIKGHSTMFCPTQRIKNSVLWHYLFNHDGSRMSYLSSENLAGGRASIHDVDTVCLEYSRNFLGWTSSTDIYTGTENVKYEKIDWAGSSFASAGLAFEKCSVVAGNFINGGASFMKGNQDIPIHLSHTRAPYFLKIHHAGNINVVLYDVKDRRGWMVDGASALLHLTRTQLSSSPYSESQSLRLEDFQHANPSDGSSAAKVALLNPKNRSLLLSDEWTYQDLVESTFHILEQIQDNQVRMMSSSAINLRFSPRDKLLGFGFKDIVKGQNILYPRVATLKASGRGWVDLTRSINAITLIGKGFGELIRPAVDSNKLCRYWSHVPTGRDYLVTCISTLKAIACQHGDCESDPLELADGIYWHKPDKLFHSCDCKRGGSKSGCERVQVLLHPVSVGPKKHPEPFEYIRGAVIFGRSRRFRWMYPNKGEPIEGGESDSEPEKGGEFLDSGIGESSTSTSEPDHSTNMNTSPLEISIEPSETNDTTMSGGISDNKRANITSCFETSSAGTPKSFQVISRGVKRTLDRVKDTAPQMFSRKKQHTAGMVAQAELDLDAEGTELGVLPKSSASYPKRPTPLLPVDE